jgi:hypothetical protein
MLFSAYDVTTSESTDIKDYNTHLFFWTGLHVEISAAIRKGGVYLTFNVCLKAGVEVERALHLNTEYNIAIRSTPKGQAAEMAGRDKGKGMAHYNSGKGHSLQGMSQRLCCGFCSRDHSRGRSGHSQGGQQHQKSD